MSSQALLEAGQRERPQIEPRQQILAKAAVRNRSAKIAIGAGDQLELARHLLVGADGQEALVLDGAQDHGLLVEAEFADLVEEQHAAVGRAQQAGALASERR